MQWKDLSCATPTGSQRSFYANAFSYAPKAHNHLLKSPEFSSLLLVSLQSSSQQQNGNHEQSLRV